MSLDVILQILSVLFVVLWTARLASRKRRSILLWAGAAALPAIAVYLIDALPDALTILCMGPMVALVFLPSRQPVSGEDEPDPNVYCPRCQHGHEPGPNFCTNCGWELSRPYATEEPAAEATPQQEPVMASSPSSRRILLTLRSNPQRRPPPNRYWPRKRLRKRSTPPPSQRLHNRNRGLLSPLSPTRSPGP